MTAPAVKLAVLNYYLDFVASYIDFKEAIVATLGGSGHEIDLWRKRGVQKDFGWMVERERETRIKLRRNFPFSLCTSLSALPGSIRGIFPRPRLDAFHFDLCGTLGPSLEDFVRVLELVGHSDGRCFAITVCEERRNADLKNTHLEEQMEQKLGMEEFTRFYNQVKAEQNLVGMEKGAIRELGVLSHVIELFERQKRFSVPDRIERVLYRSDLAHEKKFWMRTYIFHLGEETVSRENRAHQLVSVWTANPLWEYRGGRFIGVELPKKERTVSYEKLRKVAEAVGGYVLEEFEALSKRVTALDEAGPTLLALLGGTNGNGNEAGVAEKTEVKKVVAVASPQKEKPVVASLTPLEAKLQLIKATADGAPAVLAKAYTEVAAGLGISTKKKGWRRYLGAHRACARGEHRPRFMASYIRERGEQGLAELAEMFSKIDRQPVTVEQLREMAKAYSSSPATSKK